ncbi:hypothetical protein [Tenggerimyces flavus]|uniref:Uncharacterized protein n=1 Tax=Tenggerimyces flavus TaxID=1708749 RepID=A0ABV7YD11_9ACTN|nr:hypothetical protein [Tenggerimyces flavus]MBM7787030.1 hypothetical protein [Tenggerimyces flavus]
MKLDTQPVFDREYARLPREHKKLFRAALHEHFLPAVDSGAFTGNPPWPTRLRIHRIADTSIYSLTWSFTGPDGRATFHLESDDEGDPVLVWRRIGTHEIYDRP